MILLLTFEEHGPTTDGLSDNTEQFFLLWFVYCVCGVLVFAFAAWGRHLQARHHYNDAVRVANQRDAERERIRRSFMDADGE